MKAEKMIQLFRRIINIMNHKAKALGLREQHIIQRHEDGGYTLTIHMIPEARESDIGSVDGIIIHRSRGIVRHEA